MATKKKGSATRAHKGINVQKICLECPSICCHDLAIEISRPRTKHEIDNYLWYLHFDTVSICIRQRKWHLAIKGRCIYLDDDRLCVIYGKRPLKCKEHTPPVCERYGCWYDVKLDTPDDLLAYLKPKKKRSGGCKSRGARKK